MNRLLAAALTLFTLAPVAVHAGQQTKVATAEKVARPAIKVQTKQTGIGLNNLGTRHDVREIMSYRTSSL